MSDSQNVQGAPALNSASVSEWTVYTLGGGQPGLRDPGPSDPDAWGEVVAHLREEERQLLRDDESPEALRDGGWGYDAELDPENWL